MLRRDRLVNGRVPGVPPGLPAELRYPVVELDPTAGPPVRRFDAFQSFARYARELSAWLRRNGYDPSTSPQVMTALGTRLQDFIRAADDGSDRDDSLSRNLRLHA